MRLFHVVAHAAPRSASLVVHGVAALLWLRLRRAFPRTTASVLMPDHLHVAAFDSDAATARSRMSHVLSAVRRTIAGAGTLWLPVPEPTVLVDSQKAARDTRYIVLNPCREGLVRDPLEWPWTTHRDVVGRRV